MKNDALIIDDLHHKYDKRECSNWILNEINLKIENGELLGLLGPSEKFLVLRKEILVWFFKTMHFSLT